MKQYYAGIDIGSTTAKLVVLDGDGEVKWSDYRRHYADIRETVDGLLRDAEKDLETGDVTVSVTGSGGLGLASVLGAPFVQEVVAEAGAVRRVAPQTDVAVELGGEDAKIIYFRGGLEQRMNGVCAGGTGSFIDRMAALLHTDAGGLDRLAASYRQLYPIAARCGVFAKSDVQPLINEGAAREDIAASILQAVVNQTISGLACGKPIRGNVAFLGGPLHFLPQLRAAFVRTLGLTAEETVVPAQPHLMAALGTALKATGEKTTFAALRERLRTGELPEFGLKRMEPLFAAGAEFDEFRARHGQARALRGDLAVYDGPCYLGVDAGSTTTKLALIGADGALLWSFYAGNDGSPVNTIRQALTELKKVKPEKAVIARTCATGYGEELVKAAFGLDEGVVETVAHCTAAKHFDPAVDCVLDIGGQDMKCIRLKDGAVDSVLLNEACSSGCGSFIESFAVSLGHTAPSFAEIALFAPRPVDLGTRCTVFMNSSVKQAQKEGAALADISAGLAYSVIRNALFKVIKLTDPAQLGAHVLVQGGTFRSDAVLRAFEKLTGRTTIRPDIAELMGCFGAALVARSHDAGQGSGLIELDHLDGLVYSSSTRRCGGCANNCLLTVNDFGGGRKHITGNRCERGAGGKRRSEGVPDLMAYKYHRMLDVQPLPEQEAKRGVIGIPRALNLYEDFPLWATMFRALGFTVKLSRPTSREVYTCGMASVPSESECYPAKLAHGHVQSLIDEGVREIFYPSVFYERREPGAQNQFNCPVVIGCPENVANNAEDLTRGKARLTHPFVSFSDEKTLEDRMAQVLLNAYAVPEKESRAAVRLGWEALFKAKADVRAEGARALRWMAENGRRGIVLAGRPYHCDPEINHGIPGMIASYGLAVLTEDSLPVNDAPLRPIRVTDQWSYHSRLYTAAEFVAGRGDLELIQLTSFGCGLDAVTSDQVAELLRGAGRLYTLLKIDEISSLGAARIRVRSLLAAMDERAGREIGKGMALAPYARAEFTKAMRGARYTILAPQMAPMHFGMVSAAFDHAGYDVVILDNDNRQAVDTGLRFVNNDACYPSLIVVGQIMSAVLSGKYDVHRLAIMMSQTGGCCRATNYIAFIRRALDEAGLSFIPVISLNAGGLEKNPGFTITLPMLLDGGKALVLGDLLMKCLYRTRPYEREVGAANALRDKWLARCERELRAGEMPVSAFRRRCREIVADFDALPLFEELRKPRVGIVGEILVKYMPLANNHLVELLEQEGAEAVVPDLMDFFMYGTFNSRFKEESLGAPHRKTVGGSIAMRAMEWIRRPADEALAASHRFHAHTPIAELAACAEPFLSLGHQYGEGWFLTGEMVHLIRSGVPNIVCIQPFGCLPNHIVGKGVMKAVRTALPQANIAAVDYDPGASEVNQLNRIKLLLDEAERRAAEEGQAEKSCAKASGVL